MCTKCILQQSFHYEIFHEYFAIRSDMQYITLANDDSVSSCIVSTGNICRLNTALLPADRVQDCSYFPSENNKEKIKKYCQISVLNQATDQAINIDMNFWEIAMLGPRNVYITHLTYSYLYNLRHPLILFIYRTYVKQVLIHSSCHLMIM